MNEPYTVIGCWPETGERFAEPIRTVSPRAAEDEMAMRAKDLDTEFYPAAVLLGDPQMEDHYTAYVDRMHEGNLDISGLFRPLVDTENGEWTVFAIIYPKHAAGPTPATGERWARTVMADSAWGAEDVAHSFAADEDGRLWVCGVLRGPWERSDRYARFIDPER